MSRLPNPEDLSRAIPPPDLRAWLDSLTLDTQLTRPEASVALKAKGFDVSPATLASLATRGGGPRYRVFMGTARYRWGDLLPWAEARSTHRGGQSASGRIAAYERVGGARVLVTPVQTTGDHAHKLLISEVTTAYAGNSIATIHANTNTNPADTSRRPYPLQRGRPPNDGPSLPFVDDPLTVLSEEKTDD
jgi:hypothetical protein